MHDTSLRDSVKFALKIAAGCPIIIHCDIAAGFLLGLHLKLENVKPVKKKKNDVPAWYYPRKCIHTFKFI